MSHVYMVVSTKDSEIENCEAFSGAKAALGRAFQLASNKVGKGNIDLICTSPAEENMTDGSVRWVFMDTNKQSVMVVYRKIEDYLLSSKDPLSLLPSTVVPADSDVLQPSPPPYDFMDRSLPVGWTVDGKPAIMGDMLDDPFNITDPLLLSDKQKVALVTARIRKSPNWHSSTPIQGYIYFRDDALEQLKNKTISGELLKDNEIMSLHSLHDDILSGALKAV